MIRQMNASVIGQVITQMSGDALRIVAPARQSAPFRRLKAAAPIAVSRVAA
jgi:hypothetical protein